jgi:protocatechuate 3,4-dioxygenase alpha subunit
VPERTPSQTVGPFFYFGLCARPTNDLAGESAGAITIEGHVFDGAGEPVPDAMVEIWQADAEGAYRTDWGWARCGTDAAGRYSFTTVKPGQVGEQAPHLEMLVFARGLLKACLTRLYFADEADANDADTVLSGLPDEDRSTLVAVGDGGAYVHDLRLQGDRQTVFFAV